MSAMANTTPIVTTVTKTTTKEKTPKETGATPRVNILDFCEEHYEEILPVIMDKNSSAGTFPARYRNSSERPKERDRLRSNDENMFGRLGKTLGIIPAAEVVLTDETLFLAESVLEVETTPTALKSHMVIPTPLTGQGPCMDLTLVTVTAHMAQKEEREMNPHYLMCRRVTPQKKYVKDLVEIYNIRQRDGETIEERFKVETGRMRGAPEYLRIFEFMHGVNNPELTKRLNKQVPKTMEEMMTATTAFIRGETDAASKKRGHTPWKSQDRSNRHGSEWKSDFQGQPREGRGSSRVTRQKVTQSFARISEITFPPLATSGEAEGPLVIEAKIGGHMIHHMYVDGGSSTKTLLKREVLSPTVVDETVAKEKQRSLLNTTRLGSFPPLPSQENLSTGNAPVKSLYANVTRKPNGKKLNFRILFTPGVMSSYARAMIELRSDVELKDNIVAAMPKIAEEGYYTRNIFVEYVWKRPRCACCKSIANNGGNKNKNVKPTNEVSKSNSFDALNSVDNDVEFGTNRGYTHLASQKANSSSSTFWNADSSSPSTTTPIIEKINNMKNLIIDGKAILVDNEGKPF
ncbi:hypothetical protein Tco_0794566 [Tanacetum coccineum]